MNPNTGEIHPCCMCESEKTGPEARTPYGICEACACSGCRGFQRYDDRDNLYTGSWPALFFTKCSECEGSGLRSPRSEDQ